MLDRCSPTRPVKFGSSGIHADSKLQMFGETVELIARMAIVAEGKVVRIPTLPRTTWNDVPVGSMEAWAVSYAPARAAQKSERLFRVLGATARTPWTSRACSRSRFPRRSPRAESL